MAFDKKKYWSRRKKGLRGQEEKPLSSKPAMIGREGRGEGIRKSPEPGPSTRIRRKTVNRLFTKKGYRNGIKIKKPRRKLGK